MYQGDIHGSWGWETYFSNLVQQNFISCSISTLCQSSHKMLTLAVLTAWMKSMLLQRAIWPDIYNQSSPAVLSSLDMNKASGPYEIPARTLKETVHEAAPSLCDLFNKLLRLGSVPTGWKLANIVPVYKKDNKEFIENYRPISLLCLVSKVMEGCLFNAIEEQVYNLVGSCQPGFMGKRSCVTQLVEVFDLIGSRVDKGRQVYFIFLDMSKAFDKVSHRKLLTLLQEHGFGGNLLSWFDFYLQNRFQRVTALGVSSEALPVTSWVPQGSTLGPMRFLFYANSLPDVRKSSPVSAFADDT